MRHPKWMSHFLFVQDFEGMFKKNVHGIKGQFKQMSFCNGCNPA